MRPLTASASIAPGPAAMALAAGVLLTGLLLAVPALVHATDQKPSNSTCTCDEKAPAIKPWSRPKLAEARPALDITDELATLEAVHLALTEVGDGASYVWHRRDGWLTGIVKPTGSFKDVHGRICRHLELSLAAGDHKGRTAGVACRSPDGRWRLEG